MISRDFIHLMLSKFSLVGQQASTSPFPVAWQFDVEGQQDPLPQDFVLDGHDPDCNDQP
jgi:hypothetical protein